MYVLHNTTIRYDTIRQTSSQYISRNYHNLFNNFAFAFSYLLLELFCWQQLVNRIVQFKLARLATLFRPPYYFPLKVERRITMSIDILLRYSPVDFLTEHSNLFALINLSSLLLYNSKYNEPNNI